ncbi:hypothetical protein EDC96DRAFT_485877 [Choanephora cucurbitarum]|nr:hypothetical protein EDC96DRAFT_485877 [Choanephora cucurbitarum]
MRGFLISVRILYELDPLHKKGRRVYARTGTRTLFFYTSRLLCFCFSTMQFNDLPDETLFSKDNLSHLVVSDVCRLFDPTQYALQKDSRQHRVDTIEKANEAVSFAAEFLESVVMMDNHWFFVTSFCMFVHEKHVDDCADKSAVGLQRDPVMFMRKKTRMGNDFFELTLRFSNVELLFTSSFFLVM